MLPSRFKTLPRNHERDLLPVTTIAHTPVAIIIPAGSRFKNLQQLIAFAKQHPGKLNYGSGGAGSSTHLAGEVFAKSAGVALTHIPYKGAV